MTKVRHLDLFFIIASGKFYTLGILRTLNSRLVLRERLTSTDLGGRRSLSDYEWNQASGASSAASDKVREAGALNVPHCADGHLRSHWHRTEASVVPLRHRRRARLIAAGLFPWLRALKRLPEIQTSVRETTGQTIVRCSAGAVFFTFTLVFHVLVLCVQCAIVCNQ